MKHYKDFIHSECEYYGECHKGREKNCLFCFCPLYYHTECSGTPETTGDGIRDCKNCFYPHIAENYDTIVEILKIKNKMLLSQPNFLFQSGGFLLTDNPDAACSKKKARNIKDAAVAK